MYRFQLRQTPRITTATPTGTPTPTPSATPTATATPPPTISLTSGQMVALGRSSYAMSLLASGKVLIVGGMDINANTLATAEVFDPATGTFASTSGPMPGPRRNCTATLLNDGRVLVAGGQDQANNVLDTALVYVPATDSFTSLTAHLPCRGSCIKPHR